ncbi:MAG: SpaA isopeptide-forming pilin-related protein [Actinomycetota bacterium]
MNKWGKGVGRLRRPLLVVTVVTAVLSSAVGLTFANHTGSTTTVGGFEIDGNYLDETANTTTYDWDTIAATADVGPLVTPDLSDSQSDDAFSGGNKEEFPDKWAFDQHKSPGKDDLTRAYIAARFDSTDAFLWMAFERLGVQGVGDAHVDFELNKSSTTTVNSVGETIPARSDGDLLIKYDYPGGNKPVVIDVLVWDGQTDDPNTTQNEEALFGQWISQPIPPGAAVDDVNGPGTTITRPDLPGNYPSPDIFGGGTVNEQRFGEVGIDLGAILPNALSCPGYSSFWTKSRASGESDVSQLKDLIAPTPIDLSTCGSITVLKEGDSAEKLDNAVFELRKDNGDGTFVAADDPAVATCTTGEEGTLGQCTFETIAPGTYFVRETQAPLGYVLDPSVRTVTLGFRDDITITPAFVDPKIRYRLTLSPPNDTNLVNNNHVFTAHLEKSLDSGSTWVDAATETLGFSLSGKGAITAISPDGLTSSTCSTDANGECAITIRSADPGDSTLTATFGKQTATTPIALSEGADKHWVNYRITLSPEATNLIGTTHTFTALLEQTTNGTIWTPVPSATVTASKTAGVGSISGGTCTTGATSAAGTCTILVTSTTPGDTTVQGSYLATVGDTSGTFSATAVKHWVDYRITVAPNGVNLVGQAHTFTVTLQRNAGNGFQALSGAHIDLGWAGVTGSSITGGTCTNGTTNVSGQCTVVANSSATGTGTLTATYSTVLDSGPATFSNTATKTWVNYTLSVTPETDTNLLPAEPTHTFTVSLGSSDPTLAPIAGKLVDLDLTSTVATITSVGPGGSINTDGLGGQCLTNLTGQCTVIVTTTSPGTATLNASYLATVGSASITVDDSGAKTWVTYRVTVSPDTATNIVGQPHTFTVKIESTDDGSVWDPVIGVKPSLSLGGPGSITGGTCVTAVTNSSGDCTTIVESSTTGVSTLTASYLATVGSASSTFTDAATKTWINYQVLVTPLEAANLIDTDHIFTVTVFKDSGDGKGFQPLAGAQPSTTLSGVGTIKDNTCDDAAGTDTSGNCLVTISSAVAGTSSLTATYLGASDAGAMLFTSAPATKSWVNYRINVTPDIATNPVGTTHVFTVTLETESGSGWGPAAGETVDLTLSGVGTITVIPGGTIASSSRSGSCTTDSAGQCTATITSSIAGSSRLTASFDAVVGSTERTFSDFGDKLWVEIFVNVDKTNDANRDGTFSNSEIAPAVGSDVAFRAVITNPGAETIVIDSLTDAWPGTPAFGVCANLIGTQLGQNQSVTCEFSVTGYSPAAGTTLTNTFQTLAHRLGDVHHTTSAQDTSIVGSPSALILGVSKTNDANGDGVFTDNESIPTSTAGVTFTVVVRNDSSVTVVLDEVTDEWAGQPPFDVCAQLVGVELIPGASISCVFTLSNYAPSSGSSKVDTVKVSGHEKGNSANKTTVKDDSTVRFTLVLGEKIVRPAVGPAELARTGLDTKAPLSAAVLLILVGACLEISSRKRRTRA